MHTFFLSIAVCAKLKDFTGSQSSVFNYHHLKLYLVKALGAWTQHKKLLL